MDSTLALIVSFLPVDYRKSAQKYLDYYEINTYEELRELLSMFNKIKKYEATWKGNALYGFGRPLCIFLKRAVVDAGLPPIQDVPTINQVLRDKKTYERRLKALKAKEEKTLPPDVEKAFAEFIASPTPEARHILKDILYRKFQKAISYSRIVSVVKANRYHFGDEFKRDIQKELDRL